MKAKFLILGCLVIIALGSFSYILKKSPPKIAVNQKLALPTAYGTPTVLPIPSFIPTPTPLSFADQNRLLGPCVALPVLMYHHVQPEAVAKANHQTALTVDTAAFQNQMSYLSEKNYHSITPDDLTNFFDHQISLPSKAILLTFDDAYADFATDAAPILKQYGLKGTMFVPTGLVDNPGYLSWSTIKELSATGLFTFANHTWSHRSMGTSLPIIEKEVSLSATQLTDHGLASNVFAYPYGTISGAATTYLAASHFSLAFTTHFGTVMCKKQRLTLPRIRVGNSSLTSYRL